MICRRRQLRGGRARTSPGTSPSNSTSTSPNTPPGASSAASHAPQTETSVGGPVPRRFFWYLSRPPRGKYLKCYCNNVNSVIFCFVIWKVFCYNKRLQTSVLLSVKQKTVFFLNTQNNKKHLIALFVVIRGGCLRMFSCIMYMPRNYSQPFSFEVIPPPQKLAFPRPRVAIFCWRKRSITI